MSGDDEQVLKKMPSFHGLLPREEVKLLLVKVGDYLVRRSEPSPGKPRHIILSLMQTQGDSEGSHYVICTNEGRHSITEKESFASLEELLTHHYTSPINENCPTSFLVNPIGRQSWELNHEDITTTKVLGEGAFGEVRAGTLKMGERTVNVAIKVAKLEKCTKEQIREITTEARLMRRFDHKNVVRCYGVAAIEEPLYVVMELVAGGGLDGYLQKNQVAMSEKLDIILQISAGLAYIHGQNIMHRDIATRNILYGEGVAKVSDFGLSRVGTSYQMNVTKKAPIRWLSPETMTSSVYTQATDVFAFGILCWEVLENGATPYPGLMVAEVHSKVVNDDYRMPIPDKTPPALQDIIQKCWLSDSTARPTMEQIAQTNFEKFEERNTKTAKAAKTTTNEKLSAEKTSKTSTHNEVKTKYGDGTKTKKDKGKFAKAKAVIDRAKLLGPKNRGETNRPQRKISTRNNASAHQSAHSPSTRKSGTGRQFGTPQSSTPVSEGGERKKKNKNR